MKHFKKSIIIFIFSISSTGLFAQGLSKPYMPLPLTSPSELLVSLISNAFEYPIGVSGMYFGSALTVKDDQSYLMNLLDCQRLNFDKAYAFTSVNPSSENYGNVSIAFKALNHSFHVQWYGNAWEKEYENVFNFLVSYDKFSVMVGIGNNPNGTGDANIFIGNLGFGMNFTPKLGAFIKASYAYGQNTKNNILFTTYDPCFSSAVVFHPSTIERYQDTVSLLLMGKYSVTNQLENGNETSYSFSPQTYIDASYQLNYTINERLVWGAQFHIPFSVTSTPMIYFYLLNGFKAEIIPSILEVSLGLITSFPNLEIDKNKKMQCNGEFDNKFTVSASLCFADNAKLQAGAFLKPSDGLSAKDAWECKWNLSFSVKF